MIISASRRTDIPCFFGDWFIKRIKAGYTLVHNPLNIHQILKVPLTKDIVDCIVFWTKNPSDKFIKSLPILDEMGYKYYFLFTITSYAQDIEMGLPKKTLIIKKFKALSKLLGCERVIWRYDPILITNEYNLEYHKKYFEVIAKALCGTTNKCIISFMDVYKSINKRLKQNNISVPNSEQIIKLAESFTQSAKKYGIQIESCCEEFDLNKFGIKHGHCINNDLINKICGENFLIKKDSGQREFCGCVKSVDIGAYNTCHNGCVYCYATWLQNIKLTQDENSEILGDQAKKNDTIKDKIIEPCKIIESSTPTLPFY